MIAAIMVLVLLAAAGACLAGGRRPAVVQVLAIGSSAVATVLAVAQWVQVVRAEAGLTNTWASIDTGGPALTLSYLADPAAATVAVMVCAIALLVQVYSPTYLRPRRAPADAAGDHQDGEIVGEGTRAKPAAAPRYPSYAGFVCLFTAAMLVVVLSGDLLVLFAAWEVMGICSYFLIAHHWEERAAREAAVKSFLVTRLGDVGLLFGIFVLGSAANSFAIRDVVPQLSTMSSTTLTVAALLVLCGVVGKSAQFPLHVWLPDAMAGPTPISALIHAATMVAAGVYLVVRLHPLFLAAPASLVVLAVLAAITMVGAALAALVQDDLKRVLAYSTISQLAYMIGALAVGASDASLFHLLSHAAFKALLFLAAGSVLYAAGTGQLAELGGLLRRMPVTAVTMLLGLAALAGVPPLAGFFSKESVLGAAQEWALHSELSGLRDEGIASFAGWTVLVAGLVTVLLTAAYATRVGLLLFAGEPRTDATRAATDPPAAMRWPLIVLAVPTVLLGFFGLNSQLLPTVLRTAGYGWVLLPGDAELGILEGGFPVPADANLSLPPAEGLTLHLLPTLLSLLLLAVGAAAAWGHYRAHRDGGSNAVSRAVSRVYPWVRGGFGVDAVYARTVVAPVRAGTRLVPSADRDVLDAYVRGAGVGSRWAGALLRFAHTGNVQTYLTALIVGAVLLAVWAAA